MDKLKASYAGMQFLFTSSQEPKPVCILCCSLVGSFKSGPGLVYCRCCCCWSVVVRRSRGRIHYEWRWSCHTTSCPDRHIQDWGRAACPVCAEQTHQEHVQYIVEPTCSIARTEFDILFYWSLLLYNTHLLFSLNCSFYFFLLILYIFV